MSDGLALDGSVLVVGAGLAGLRTVKGLRERGFTGTCTMLGDELHPPYDRPPLTKQVAVGKWEAERTLLLTPQRRDELQLDLHIGDPAVALDLAANSVRTASGATLAADRIVVATGASPRLLTVDAGVEPLVVRTWDDGVALQRALAGAPCRVVVVGAGFIGAEVASSARSLGHEVTVVEALDVPLQPILGEAMGAACGLLPHRAGVELLTGASVTSVSPGGDGPHGATVTLADGTVLVADVLVVGIGVVPNTAWLEGSGLAVDNGIVTDAALFAADRVVAVGDVARFTWHRLGAASSVRIEHWQVAADHGEAAATNLLLGRSAAQPIDLLPYFWSDQYGVKLQMLGRPAPEDDVEVVLGGPEEGSLLALYVRQGRVAAAFAISKPRQLMQLRAGITEGCSVEAAKAVLGL